jgi:transposase
VKSQKLNHHYKHKSSGFEVWSQKEHAEKWLLFPENIGTNLSIDEVSLSKGELYTFVTNKSGKGKSGTMVACIEGTKSEDIQEVLGKIDLDKRLMVKEITLDMAKNMEAGVKEPFPNASLVTDRFHVVKLALDALQHLRVKERWAAVDAENKAIAAVKTAKKERDLALISSEKISEEETILLTLKYQAIVEKNPVIVYENGDSPKQLLARSRYVLAKKEVDWTKSQAERATILFENFPNLKTSYHQTLAFRNIYEQKDKEAARVKFEDWIQKVDNDKMEAFYSVANTVNNHLENILNFFQNRNTNANAESFNAKIKLFRANQRGVTDTKFFLFRLAKLFA